MMDLQKKNAKKLLQIGDICVKMIAFQGGHTNLFTLIESLKIMGKDSTRNNSCTKKEALAQPVKFQVQFGINLRERVHKLTSAN